MFLEMEQTCPKLAICKLQQQQQQQQKQQKQQNLPMRRFKDRKPTILMAVCREFPKPLYAIVKKVTQVWVIQLPDKSSRTQSSLILLPSPSI